MSLSRKQCVDPDPTNLSLHCLLRLVKFLVAIWNEKRHYTGYSLYSFILYDIIRTISNEGKKDELLTMLCALNVINQRKKYMSSTK